MDANGIIKTSSLFWLIYLFPGSMWVILCLKDGPFSGYRQKKKERSKTNTIRAVAVTSDLGKPALEYYLTSGFQKPLKYINCSPFFSVAFHFWIFFLLYLQGRNCDREFNNVEIFNINHYSKF
jgi:hypothetical protein